MKSKIIVIDPGHGGKDPGATGYEGLQEKDVVLKVGLKLRKKLEEKGFNVKMTRDKDEFVELGKRPQMANDWGGDLFISLHCDAVIKEEQESTEGFKFWTLRTGNAENDKVIARRENLIIARATGKKNKTEISMDEWKILDNKLASYAEKNVILAKHLINAFEGGSLEKKDAGIEQAGFLVLTHALMPAVLAELGFITHPADGAFMATEEGQNEIAERIANGITMFLNSL